MTVLQRVALVGALVALVGRTSPARADVDLTGSWNVEIVGFGITNTDDVVQSGTALDIGEFTGTIDPSTGVFSTQGPPEPGGVLPGGIPYGPSPNPTLDGTAAADGNSFDGTELAWFVKVTPPVDFQHFPWFGLGVSVHGTRLNLATCGNGQPDPGEFCDDGTGNGVDGCCASNCTLVDADSDGVCDAADDCPTIYDPIQSCVVPLTLSRARASANGVVRLRGTLSPLIGSFTQVAVSAGGSSRTDVVTHCTGDPANYVNVRCTNADGSVRFHMHRTTEAAPWTLSLTARGLPPIATPSGPIGMSIIDLSNSRTGTGQLTSCKTHTKRVTCVP